MAAPTNTYCDYAAGNDYKGATFTDGAYTSATKTLTKAGAFAASQVNHWLYLESNDGGSIVAGYYKIATVSSADAVILATDAGAGVDDDAAKCVQAAGTTAKPWRSIQGALDLITRDATNGDQVNIKVGTAQILQAAVSFVVYGAATEGAPLILRGYTASANDGGIGEIDCGGFQPFGAGSRTFFYLVDLEIHTMGNNIGVYTGNQCAIIHCEVHKGASTPSGKALIYNTTYVIGNYVHDSGATGTGIDSAGYLAFGNYVKDCPTGIKTAGAVINNIVVDSTAAGIASNADNALVIGNTIYSSTASTGKGISIITGNANATAINNIIEGYSGAGGIGISTVGDVVLLGYNAFYNNTTPESLGDVYVDLGNDATLASSPFTNAAAGDFSLATAVVGAIDGAYPGAWYGPAGTTDHADIGAVQNGAGTGGAVNISPFRGNIG